MSKKTIILREDQFNEICGLNTSYLDNSNDYAEDGTTTVKAAGAVSDDNGEKGYSKPITGKDISHEMAPETLWALLFRNGGHGLWGHWGSGLRARELTEENDRVKNINLDHIREPLYDYDLFENGDANYYFSTSEPLANNTATMEEFLEMIEYSDDNIKWEFDGSQAFAMREDGSEIQLDAGGNGDFMNHIVTVTCIEEKLQESNSELEGNDYVLDLGDGKKKRSYTSLTTEKSELEDEIALLRRDGNMSPEGQNELKRKEERLYRINMKLGMETKRVKDSKRIKKDIFGDDNAFIKPHTKNSKNGKAHSKKMTEDPNVGTGFITYR